MAKIGRSKFSAPLANRYAKAPSIILCRVPEVELLSRKVLLPPVLDHCCGDGYIASLAFPGRRIDAGVDLSLRQLEAAGKRKKYELLSQADAGDTLPFRDSSFRTIINNSGIEHIDNLERAVSELSRVLMTDGKLHFSVLNRRYFDRWPLDSRTADAYKRFQPFYHALNEEEWEKILQAHGFDDISFTDYLPEEPSRMLAALDYKYSAHYFGERFFLSVALERLLPGAIRKKKWLQVFENLHWDAGKGEGSGFLVSARKKG